MKKSEYDIQAKTFLEKTNTKLTVEFDGFKKHFPEDEHPRFVFNVTLKRGSREYSFKFGDSLNAVQEYFRDAFEHLGGGQHFRYPAVSLWEEKQVKDFPWTPQNIARIAPPSAYSILACITHYDPGSFENFCSDMGYDTDSRKAEATYKAVLEEYRSLSTLYNEEEMDQLSEIN